MQNTIRVDTNDHIATVTLLRTTMPVAFFDELGEAFRALAAQRDLRAVIVCSAAKHFTFGLDLPDAAQHFGEALQGGTAAPRAHLHDVIVRLQQSLTAVADCPVPVIAAVHGRCIGGGVDLITACDIRIATEDATFSVRETKVAIVADLGSLQRLPAIVGHGHTRELAFTGKDVDGPRAKAIGLVNDLYPDTETLMAAAKAMAQAIADNAPLTVRGVKQVLRFGEDRRVADGLAYVAAWNSAFLASDDLGEAMGAFMQKRPPKFSGK